MASYCQKSDVQAIVSYTMNGVTIQYISKTPPVDIGLNPEKTIITYGSAWQPSHPGAFQDTVIGHVTSDGICHQSGSTCYQVLSNGFVPVFSGNGTCSVQFQYVPANITITNSDGSQFVGNGDNITYTVACGINCPPGQMKCSCSNYPGYCCIDCSSIDQRLDSLTQQVKRLVPNVG